MESMYYRRIRVLGRPIQGTASPSIEAKNSRIGFLREFLLKGSTRAIRA